MLRTLARSTQALRHPAPPTLPGVPPHLVHSFSATPHPTHPVPNPSPAFVELYQSRVSYFLECPFVGPIKANQLAGNACRTWADVVELDGKRGSGVRLDCRQRRFAEGELWMEEWVAKKRSQGQIE